jgi:NAD(P)-dependent dehydrogenase (short-subunit alcohol dehydrogenase family)
LKIKRFEGKVVVITGAGSDIGFEVAKQFVEEGAKVVLNDFDESLAKNGNLAKNIGSNYKESQPKMDMITKQNFGNMEAQNQKLGTLKALNL